MKRIFAVLLFLVCLVSLASAQMTVLNVPSVDLAGKGKLYGRYDTFYNPTHSFTLMTPNLMYGLNDNVDLGLNFESFNINSSSTGSFVPNVKWKIYDPKGEGIALYVGDKIYLPTSRKSTVDVGNFFYGMATLQADGLGRLGAGIYNSQDVYGNGNRSGALLTLEHWFTEKYVGAIDWQSGAAGMTTAGLMWYPRKTLMIIPSYMIGNNGVRQGNHGFVLYVGYAFN